jgi:hypothetical protein
MTFKEKIDKVLKAKKMKLWQLAEESGLGSTLEKAYAENREMRTKGTDQFLQKIGISSEWWEFGKGEMITTPVLKIQKGGKSPELIPFFDAVAVGGNAMLAEVAPVSEPTEYINPGTWLRSATGSLRVYGHSMFPKYPAGSIIAYKDVHDVNLIHYGEDYVIELEDRRIIKRVQRSKKEGCIQVNSYNTMKDETSTLVYAPYDIPMSAIKRMHMVLGLVILEASV